MKLDTKEFETKMQKTLAALGTDFESIRVGRANPTVLNRISVDYWGVPTPITQIGEVKVPDARTLLITPWEANLLKSIERAINESDLVINPQNDGQTYIVTSGLHVGDRIVTKGITKLTDGMEIVPITEQRYEQKIDEAAKLAESQGNAHDFAATMSGKKK